MAASLHFHRLQEAVLAPTWDTHRGSTSCLPWTPSPSALDHDSPETTDCTSLRRPALRRKVKDVWGWMAREVCGCGKTQPQCPLPGHQNAGGCHPARGQVREHEAATEQEEQEEGRGQEGRSWAQQSQCR